MLKKSVAMLAGSFAVYMAVSCTSAALNDKDPKIDGVSVKDALAELGVDADAIVDAVRDALEDGAPTDAKADPAPISGTRLRVRYSVAKSADGAVRKTFAGWFDSARKEPCADPFYPMSDGSRRCIPAGMQVGGYQDSACSKPFGVLTASTCSVTPRYVTAYTAVAPGSCSVYTLQIFAVAAESGAPSTWYRRETDGKCTAMTSPWPYTAPTYKTYTTTGEVAASEFAAFTLTEETD